MTIEQILASPAFTAVALAVAGAIGTLLAGGVVKLWTLIRLRLLKQLSPADMAYLDGIAAKAVRYAFQVVESKEGQDRLAAASDVLAQLAKTRGIPLTAEQIRLYIEAAYVDFKLTVATTPIVSEPAGPAVEIGGRA